MLFPIGHPVLLPWIQTSLAQKPKIAFNWNKRIIWACSFVKKSRWVYALFKSIFLRNQSFSSARWFYSKKKRQIGKGNLYLTENQFSRNEIWCVLVNHNHIRHICTKGFLALKLQWSRYWQIIIFLTTLPQIPHSHKNCNFKSIIGFFRPFYDSDMLGMYFFIFASCEPLRPWVLKKCQTIDSLELVMYIWIRHLENLEVVSIPS